LLTRLRKDFWGQAARSARKLCADCESLQPLGETID
jgi:hypothetical protein